MRARPQELELILVGISLGEEVSRETVMLSCDSQNWSYTWANLPTTRKGEAVDYTLSVADVKGYSSVLVDNGDGTFTVTNTYVRDPNYEYFTVNVVWNDSNNAAGRRPSSLDAKLELYLRLFDTWEWMSFDDPVSLSDEYNWRAAFPVSKALIRDMDIRDFRIVLTDDYNDIIGYFDPVITRTGNNWTISFDACAVLSVKIEWKGDNDNELLTRDAVEVDLFKRYTDHWNVLPDTISQTVTLDETNSWEYTWTKLPLTEAGLNLSYYVSLVSNNVTGYQYGTTARKGETTVIDFTLKPDYVPLRTNVKVSLDWKDEDGASRPDEIEVTLCADDDEVETVKLNAGNNWEYTWENLLEKKGSVDIEYTVSQTKIPGYTLDSNISRTESTDNKPGSVDIVITNTASVSVTVKIEWMDLDSPDRPTEPEVRLYRGTGYREGFDAANNPDGLTELLNEELVYWFDENGKPSEGRIVKASDGWTYTWEDLLKYNPSGEETNDVKIKESVGGLKVTKTVEGKDSDLTKDFNFTVTLTGATSITGTYGEMEFNDGVATFTLKHGETKTATGLPTGYTYTVVETNNYGYAVTSTGETGIIVQGRTVESAFVNFREAIKGNLTISKSVVDGDPEQEFDFVVYLYECNDSPLHGQYYYSGSKSGFIQSGDTISLKDGQSITIYNLPVGTIYTVTELPTPKYAPIVIGGSGTIEEGRNSHAEFVNIYDPVEVDVPTQGLTVEAFEDSDQASQTAADSHNSLLSGLAIVMLIAFAVIKPHVKFNSDKAEIE